MDEFPDSSDLAASRNRGEPCWGFEITSRVLCCARLRSQPRFLVWLRRSRAVKVSIGTRVRQAGQQWQALRALRRSAIRDIAEFQPGTKAVQVSTLCSIFLPARSNGAKIPITLPHGKLFLPLAARMTAFALTPYPFWSIPRMRVKNLRKALSGTNTEDLPRRLA